MNDPSIPTKSETDCFSAMSSAAIVESVSISIVKDRRRSLCNSPRTSSQVGFISVSCAAHNADGSTGCGGGGIIGAGGNPGDCGGIGAFGAPPMFIMPLAPSVGRPAEAVGPAVPSVAAQTAYMPHPAQPKPAPAASLSLLAACTRSLPQASLA